MTKNGTLTKSLHTVTSATNVATYLLGQERGNGIQRPTTVASAVALASRALDVLGQYVDICDNDIENDPTIRKIVIAVYSALSGEGNTAARYAVEGWARVTRAAA